MSRRLLPALVLGALATGVAAVLVSVLAPQPERVAPLAEIPIGAIWIVAGLIASLNVTRIFVLIGTPVAAETGDVDVTVGAVPWVPGGVCVSR